MYRIAIIGDLEQHSQFVRAIKCEEKKGTIEIVGIGGKKFKWIFV